MKLDRLAGREEDHDLLGAVLLQEGKEQEEPGFGGTHHVPLEEQQGGKEGGGGKGGGRGEGGKEGGREFVMTYKGML